MKSVYYGKSAQDLSLGNYGGWERGGFGEGRVSLYKDVTFLVSQHKHTRIYKQKY